MNVKLFPKGSSNVIILGSDNYILLQYGDEKAPIFENQIVPLGGAHEGINPYNEALREIGEELSLNDYFDGQNLVLNYSNNQSKKVSIIDINLKPLDVWLLSLNGTKLFPKYTHFVNWNYSLNLNVPVKNLKISEGDAFTCPITKFNSTTLPIASDYCDVIDFAIGNKRNFVPHAKSLDLLLSNVNAKKPQELKKYV